MARYNEKRISYKQLDALIDMLSVILAELKTRGKIRNFLKDLLNRQERAMLARRLLIAELLYDDWTYRDICKKLKCGHTTVARIERWLSFGRDGFKRALKIKRRYL